MYEVIVTSANGKRYYYDYVGKDGNIKCSDLPPFQDKNKARACYWNDEEWIFDEVRYAEILAEIEAKKKAAQAEADRIAAIPNNEELNEMLLTTMLAVAEITNVMETAVEPLASLAGLLKAGDE